MIGAAVGVRPNVAALTKWSPAMAARFVPSGIIDITPSDTTDLPKKVQALSVTTPGFVKVTMVDGSRGHFFAQPGTMQIGSFARVWETTDRTPSATGLTGWL